MMEAGHEEKVADGAVRCWGRKPIEDVAFGLDFEAR